MCPFPALFHIPSCSHPCARLPSHRTLLTALHVHRRCHRHRCTQFPNSQAHRLDLLLRQGLRLVAVVALHRPHGRFPQNLCIAYQRYCSHCPRRRPNSRGGAHPAGLGGHVSDRQRNYRQATVKRSNRVSSVGVLPHKGAADHCERHPYTARRSAAGRGNSFWQRVLQLPAGAAGSGPSSVVSHHSRQFHLL